MTIAETVAYFARSAAERYTMLRDRPLAFALSAMKAGAYVGLGIILIFSVGQEAEPSFRALVMGASFGIALTLVVFAGSDLFTGHAMYGAHAWLTGGMRGGPVLANWAASCS
jgi:nitrite transporter NirC